MPSREIKHLVRKFDEVKDPEQRKKLYHEYQRAVHEDRNSLAARAVKGAIAGAGAAALTNAFARGLPTKLLPPKYFYPAAALVGAGVGIKALAKRKTPVTSLERHYGATAKTAYVLESKYWPMGDMAAIGSSDSTVADLQNPHMPDELRKKIMESGVVIRSKAGKESRNAFTAGGRALTMKGKIPVEDRPAILAHELGHHRRKHLTKSFATNLAGLGGGALLARHLAKKHLGPDYTPVEAENLTNAAMVLGGGAGALLTARLLSPAIGSEVHEREADVYAARKTSPAAIERALDGIHRAGITEEREHLEKQLGKARSTQRKATGWLNKWMSNSRVRELESAHKNLSKFEQEMYERPATRMGRAWLRVKHGLGGEHPPLWSRIDTIREEAARQKTGGEAFDPTYTPGQKQSFSDKNTNWSAMPSSYSWDQKRRPWHYGSDPRSGLAALKSRLKGAVMRQAL